MRKTTGKILIMVMFLAVVVSLGAYAANEDGKKRLLKAEGEHEVDTFWGVRCVTNICVMLNLFLHLGNLYIILIMSSVW